METTETTEKTGRPAVSRKKIVLIALLIIAAAAAAVTIAVLAAEIKRLSAENEELSKSLDADEDYIAAAAARVYEYYGPEDYIEVSDYSYDKIMLKAHTKIPASGLDPEKLSRDGDLRFYTENEKVISKLGVDVSYFQGEIDWEAVKDAGIEFAMIRAGYRGYESGLINKDKRFDEYMSGAAAAGIHTGVYFYSQAITKEEAVEEAEFVISLCRGYEVSYPVVFDWEITGEESARTNDLSPALLTDITDAFCAKTAEAGYIPMIYASKRQALFKMDRDSLSAYDFWLCEYKDVPEYPYMFQMWQYSSDARVAGISTDVDINISFIDYPNERIRYVSE